jgi:hypothetical protein
MSSNYFVLGVICAFAGIIGSDTKLKNEMPRSKLRESALRFILKVFP